jgi:hypothetical protein
MDTHFKLETQRGTCPGRDAAFFMPLRRSTVLVVKRVDRLQACGIVLDSQGGFAPPSAVAFGQP